VSQSSNALMTKISRPSVSTMNGSEINCTIGLMNVLIRPKMIATTSKVNTWFAVLSLVRSTPSTIQAATPSAMALMMIRVNIDCMAHLDTDRCRPSP
jgi:hypothetical protein